MFHNLDQLRLQLERDNLLEVNPRTCLEALRTQFKEFFTSKRVNSSEHLNQCWQKDFKEYTFCEPDTYRRDLLVNMDTLEVVIHRAVITYGRLQLQSQDVQINPVQAVDDKLIVSKSSGIESENNNALSKSVNETQLQQHESLITESTTLEVNLNTDIKALDAGSVITESSRTKSDKHDTSNSSGTYITHAVDADIRPVNDQVPFAEVDSNTTPDSTNMCHRGGEIDQDAEQYQAKSPLLKAELVKSKEMIEKETYNELSRSFKSELAEVFGVIQSNTRSCLYLRIPTRKMFTDYTTKVDSEPPNGSNDDITNPYECDQTLNVSASTTNLSAGQSRITYDAVDLSVPGSYHNLLLQHLMFPKQRHDRKRYSAQCLIEYFNPSAKCAQPFMKLLFKNTFYKYHHKRLKEHTLKYSYYLEEDDNVVTEKQARNVQTSLTLSSAKLEIHSMVDVSIHEEDLAVQRTPLKKKLIQVLKIHTDDNVADLLTKAFDVSSEQKDLDNGDVFHKVI
ncbi:hypothetical protein Tco_0309379 [Tanacetum coccineum]